MNKRVHMIVIVRFNEICKEAFIIVEHYDHVGQGFFY